MKAKVYIETTIPSYLVARPSRDLLIAAHDVQRNRCRRNPDAAGVACASVRFATLAQAKRKQEGLVLTGTLLATKGDKAPAAAGTLQRGQTVTDTLVDLNFKVPPEFRDRFKRHAFEERLKNVQLLVRALEAWEQRENLPARRKIAQGVGR